MSDNKILVPIQAMDSDMAQDMATGSESAATKMKKSLILMQARQSEDSKFDASAPPGSVIKEGFFATASSSHLAIFTAATLIVLAIMIKA
jgi:hypothetical protein